MAVDTAPAYFLVLGPAGSGCSTALSHFAEHGFLTVGSVQPDAFLTVFDTLRETHSRIAFTASLTPQTVERLDTWVQTLQQLQQRVPEFKVLYLNATEPALVKRYLDLGKKHPFEREGLQQAVSLDKSLQGRFKVLKEASLQYYEIDTSALPPKELGNKIAKILGIAATHEEFTVYITSFGFKHGLPLDAELMFDMRFLKNPFYIESLRSKTGLDAEVRDYIFSFPQAGDFFSQWSQMLDLMLPLYQQEGKSRVAIAIGCTGGQHRSVCMTEGLAAHLKERHPGYQVVVNHREISRWPMPEATAADKASSSLAP